MAQSSCAQSGRRLWHAQRQAHGCWQSLQVCCFTKWLQHTQQTSGPAQHQRAGLAPQATMAALGLLAPGCRHASSLAPARKLRRQFKQLNPSQLAAALADQELDTGSHHSEAQEDDDEALLEQPDPFAPQQTAAGKARRRRLGVLQSVPVVAPAHEHLASALKRASKVAYTATIKNDAEKERNRAARQMDTLMKELSVPLSKYVNGFPSPEKLHPFDAALLQLTVSTVMYRSVLGKVGSLRKSLQEMGKAYANRASNAPNKAGALAVALEGCAALENVYRNGAKSVEDLKEVAKKLRTLPVLEVGLPTLALVGAPNVGKSSLVQVLSSGTPEVCNYPFTTRSIKMGHFFLDGRKHQVTDTPGLLARPDDERNKMEMLTLAALEFLPTSVLYVMDLTEECGTSVQDQWDIRQEVRARFPHKAWIDVFSKADMLEAVFQQADSAPDGPVPDAATHVHTSPHASSNGHASALASGGHAGGVASDGPQEAVGGAAALLEGQQQQGQGQVVAAPITGAADLASRLPMALRVSSTTRDGISGLQARIVVMFQEQLKQQQQAAAEAAALAAQAAQLQQQQQQGGMQGPSF